MRPVSATSYTEIASCGERDPYGSREARLLNPCLQKLVFTVSEIDDVEFSPVNENSSQKANACLPGAGSPRLAALPGDTRTKWP